MTRQKQRILRIVCVASVFLVAFGATSASLVLISKNTEDIENAPVADEKPEEPEEDPVEKHKLSIIMVGDALIHEGIYASRKVAGGYDFKPLFTEVKPIIQQYDLAFYNQETILGGSEIGLSHYPRFNSPYEVGDAFLDMGFNIVSLANNHTLDRGRQAVTNSNNYWNSKANVMHNGSALTAEEKSSIDIREKNGIKYAMLSYTTTTNGITPYDENCVSVYSADGVKADIESVRDKVDLLMVAMHWGAEYETGVRPEQRQIAEYLAGLGVNIIIGSHPHVIEPAEYIGNTLVVYSTGNFVSAQFNDEQLSGLMMTAEINFEKNNKTGKKKLSVDKPVARFVYTDKKAVSGVKYQVYPYEKLTTQIMPNFAQKYVELSARMKSLDSKIEVAPLYETAATSNNSTSSTK